MIGYCWNKKCSEFNLKTGDFVIGTIYDDLDSKLYCRACEEPLCIEKYIDEKKSDIQVYKVNEEDYINDYTLSPKMREICTSSLFEINNIDMVNINNLFLNSEKEFPFDGLNSKELWNIIMETGLKLKNLHKENIIDETFKNHISGILNKFILFCMLPENIKLKVQGEKVI